MTWILFTLTYIGLAWARFPVCHGPSRNRSGRRNPHVGYGPVSLDQAVNTEFIYRRSLFSQGNREGTGPQKGEVEAVSDTTPAQDDPKGDELADSKSQRWLQRKSVAVTLAAVILLFTGLPLELVALGAAAVLLLGRTKPEKVHREIDWLLHGATGVVWLGFLVILFAENGICRATAESLFGAEVAQLAPPEQMGTALGILRFWKPLGVIAVALMGGILAGHYGVGSILLPLTGVQALAIAAALLIHERQATGVSVSLPQPSGAGQSARSEGLGLKDRIVWVFLAAMILFHIANAPGGVYLGLFLKTDLHAPDRFLSYVFIIDMVAWMLVVWPAGRLADRLGRKPLLIAGWVAMTLRLVLVAVAQAPWQVLAIEVLDGLAQGLFIVLSAAWMTDRLADHKRVGEAQVLVGSALVAGSAIGPMLSGLVVDSLGYRGMFCLLAGVGVIATLLVMGLVPESFKAPAGEAGTQSSRTGTRSLALKLSLSLRR